MKRVHPSLWLVVAGISIYSAGCTIETEVRNPPTYRSATNVIINELFTLPATHPVVHSWVEFYNPRTDTVNMTGWRLSYTTRRTRIRFDVIIDSLGNIRVDQREIPRVLSTVDSVFEVVAPGVRVAPGAFLTIVGNEDRLLDHTRYGTGRGTRLALEPFSIPGVVNLPLPVIQDPFPSINFVDSTITIAFYDFHFRQSDQIVLMDSSRNLVDCLRYGNYNFTGAVTNPLLGPSNQTLGVIPEFESIARYAGAHFSGNSSSDFYFTRRPELVLTPHGYNQLAKP